MKFSVIIPTLWLSHRTDMLLTELILCDEVGEIILIDNSDKIGYTDNHEKIVYLKQEQNIYVNPAWNLGVSKAKYDNICICNDDINFDTSVFRYIADKIESGVTGMDYQNYQLSNNLPFRISNIDQRPHGWGCLLFIKKQNYIQIPEHIKIACGDDLLLTMVKPSRMLSGLKVETEMSTSCSKGTFYIQCETDLNNYKQWLTSNSKNL